MRHLLYTHTHTHTRTHTAPRCPLDLPLFPVPSLSCGLPAPLSFSALPRSHRSPLRRRSKQGRAFCIGMRCNSAVSPSRPPSPFHFSFYAFGLSPSLSLSLLRSLFHQQLTYSRTHCYRNAAALPFSLPLSSPLPPSLARTVRSPHPPHPSPDQDNDAGPSNHLDESLTSMDWLPRVNVGRRWGRGGGPPSRSLGSARLASRRPTHRATPSASHSRDGDGKPAFSYATLITLAIDRSGAPALRPAVRQTPA